MTALVVFELDETYDLSQTILISKKAIEQEGFWGELRPGENLSIEALLYIMLIESSNDAAYAVTELIGQEGVVNLMNAIPDSKATILFFETPEGQIRASLRTEKDDVDVSKIAKLFGGGGHKKAAGFTIDADLKLNGNEWEIVLK